MVNKILPFELVCLAPVGFVQTVPDLRNVRTMWHDSTRSAGFFSYTWISDFVDGCYSCKMYLKFRCVLKSSACFVDPKPVSRQRMILLQRIQSNSPTAKGYHCRSSLAILEHNGSKKALPALVTRVATVCVWKLLLVNTQPPLKSKKSHNWDVCEEKETSGSRSLRLLG